MSKTKKILLSPLLILIFLLERISKPAWDFIMACLIFWLLFKWVNSDIEKTNIMDAGRVIFGNALIGLVALQTLPQMFIDIFNDK